MSAQSEQRVHSESENAVLSTQAEHEATTSGINHLTLPTNRADAWLIGILVTIIALAPLPLGSNRPFPAAILALVTGFLLIVQASVMLLVKRGQVKQVAGLGGPRALFTIAALWALVQLAPAPLDTLAHPLWKEASAALSEALPPRITIDPTATATALMHLLTYAAVFWLALTAAADSERAARARQAVAAIGAVYAAYGITNFFIGTGWAPGQYIASHSNSAVATFVNRNSFATFAGLCLLCAFSILLEQVRHILSTARPLRQKTALIVETLFTEARWTCAAALVLIIALFLTASRAGVISSLIAIFALTALQAGSGGGSKSQRRTLVFIALIIVGTGFVTGGDRLVRRFDNRGLLVSEETLRHEIFMTTLQAIRSVPLTGTGYGTYETAIEAYRAGSGEIFDIWEKTHNSYLESAMELGLPAALALHGAILWLAIICYRGIAARRRGRAFPALGVAATLLVGVHALVDFSLQIPAVAIIYAFILGFAVAQARAPKQRCTSAAARDTSA